MFSTVLAAVIAVFASMIFPVQLTLTNAAADASAPQGIVEVLSNLLLNIVANPVSSLVNAKDVYKRQQLHSCLLYLSQYQ